MTRSMLTRRQFIAGSLAAAAGLVGVGAYSTRVEPFWIEIVKRPLAIASLPDKLLGATLVQLSDLHAGRVPDDYLLRTLKRVSALNPDILVVTGDLTQAAGPSQIERVFSHLPIARHGTICTLGNHDYGADWLEGSQADMVASIVGSYGARVLRNEMTVAAGLQIVGMDDLWSNRFDPVAAFADVDPSSPTLCLTHNPDTVDQGGWGEFRGWVLAGHTHGGQVKLPFLGPFDLPVRNKRYSAGEFDLGGGRKLYINRGVGFLRQIRFDVRPEVTAFTLERA